MARMTLTESAEELVDALADLGVVASVDADQVVPPGALLVLDRVEYPAFGDVRELYWTCYLVAPSTGTVQAFKWLDGLIDDVRSLAVDGEFELATITLPSAGNHPAAQCKIITEGA